MPRKPKPCLPQPGMDPTRAPRWWLTKPAEIRAFLESLQGVEVEEIGKSAGGRPLIAASWGEREMLPGRTCASLPSAIAGGDPSAFYGKGERKRQVLLFVGAAHGTEFEGTVAALSFLSVLATGRDLRGRRQPDMAREGRKHRFLLIPILNVDGRERALDHVHYIGCDPDYFSRVTQGIDAEGKILQWPDGKLIFPRLTPRLPKSSRLRKSSFDRRLGTYYNDAGVNLVYDMALGPDCQPENAALLRYARREMPDCVILSHSNNGSLVEPAHAFIPAHFRQRSEQIAAVVGMRCAREGYPKFRIPKAPTSYAGDLLYQGDALYHACGALPLTIEFPCGWQNLPPTHGEILDIGLTVLEEVCAFGARYRFRPVDPRWK